MKPSMLKRMERFNKAIEILKELKNKDKKVFLNDIYLISIAERNIQVACEFALDFSASILSNLDARVPESYKEIIEELETFKIIDTTLKNKMKEIVGLRNIIVHWYADIKYDLIFDSLEDIITVLEKFVKKLLEYCEKTGIDP